MIDTKMKIGDYEIDFEAYVTEFLRYDAVLGLSWIRKHNPVIDWQTGILYFHMKKGNISIIFSH